MSDMATSLFMKSLLYEASYGVIFLFIAISHSGASNLEVLTWPPPSCQIFAAFSLAKEKMAVNNFLTAPAVLMRIMGKEKPAAIGRRWGEKIRETTLV